MVSYETCKVMLITRSLSISTHLSHTSWLGRVSRHLPQGAAASRGLRLGFAWVGTLSASFAGSLKHFFNSSIDWQPGSTEVAQRVLQTRTPLGSGRLARPTVKNTHLSQSKARFFALRAHCGGTLVIPQTEKALPGCSEQRLPLFRTLRLDDLFWQQNGINHMDHAI